MREAAARLHAILSPLGRIAVAVSGGVDSLTLAAAAQQALGADARLYHAVSPAVPPAATRRARALAEARGWVLDVFNAGEFNDPSYRANPVNRCFFCKTNLYGAIARRTDDQIVAGTNMDDLGEYRPGLEAARAHHVRHPFVEAGIGKSLIRELAAHLGLGDVADLPASPCLSSRVETGRPIDADVLVMIDRVEQQVRDNLGARTVRCRVRAEAIVLELDAEALARLDDDAAERLRRSVDAAVRAGDMRLPVSIAAYRNGSAFLRADR